NIQDCLIRNFSAASGSPAGITFQPSTGAKLHVSSTVVSDNAPGDGIDVTTSLPSTISVTLDRVEVDNNNIGLLAFGALSSPSLKVAVTDSVFSKNQSIGIDAATALGAGTSLVMVRDSTITGNGTGVKANATGAIVRLTRSVVTANATGWTTFAGGVV